MAAAKAAYVGPALVAAPSLLRASPRGSLNRVVPLVALSAGLPASKGDVLVDTWMEMKGERAGSQIATASLTSPSEPQQDSPPSTAAPPTPDASPSAHGSMRLGTADSTTAPAPRPAQAPETAPLPLAPAAPPAAAADADDASLQLLHKFSVGPTGSPRLRALADLALMVLTLIPTALLRVFRAAMGLFGVTEHRWRGISMAVPLTHEDRSQLQLLAASLVAGSLGRRPDPPERGPLPPALQLLLDVHAILAAASATAASYCLPYEGLPEAALQARLAAYLRGVAGGDTVCTQDCFKAMRKMGRATLKHLCSMAPRMPTAAPAAASSPSSSSGNDASGSAGGALRGILRPSPSSRAMMARSKPKLVAKAYMRACLLHHTLSHAGRLVQLVAELPNGTDLVETMTLIDLTPGAEYLRLLSAARGGTRGGGGGGSRGAGLAGGGGDDDDPAVELFADQLEHMREFGRLRPSDAKTEPQVQGMAINARVHAIGIIPRAPSPAAALAAVQQPQHSRHSSSSTDGGAAGAQAVAPKGAVAEATDGPAPTSVAALLQQRLQDGAGGGGGSGRSDASDAVRSWHGVDSSRAGTAAGTNTDGNSTSDGYGGAGGGGGGAAVAAGRGLDAGGGSRGRLAEAGAEEDAREGLLQAQRGRHQPTSSQPDLPSLDASSSSSQPLAATASVGKPPLPPGKRPRLEPPGLPPPPPGLATLSAASRAPSTILYPTARLDAFTPLYACPRSGAFAVHGRSPRGVGLSHLRTAYASCHALPLAEQAALLRRLGYATPEQLRREVELRKALCVAQALPVVLASLRLMLRQPAALAAAFRTRAFLHVQQSMLSDLHRHERAYLQDTAGALEVLAERLVVRFVEGSEQVLPLHLSGPNIVVSLSAACVSAEALAAAGIERAAFCAPTYSLTPLLFSMGVNSLQSLGWLFAWRGGETLQESINRLSLERLNEYAGRAGCGGGPALAALNAHYSPHARRPPKDTAMFGLVRCAAAEVGGGRAVNCKSGKDRTALEVSRAMAAEVVAAGVVPAAAAPWLAGQLLRGLSYAVTSQNHGQPPAYAFSEMEILSLPAGWRPDWRLCGKVAS